MKVAIYCRVSSEIQAEDETPIAGQLEECYAYAELKEWEVVKVYKDEGFTGRNTKRPAFQQMMADANQKPPPFEKVLVWKGSRIARNVEDRIACTSFLARKGIEIVSIKEPEFEGAMKVLMVPILAGIDEYQSYVTGEDTLRGMKTLARQGYSTDGKPPKGYRVNRTFIGLKKNGEPRFRVVWEPDPEWRDKAYKAFQMLVEGRSSEDIIKQTGVVNNVSSLSTYFRNRTFIGERVFNIHQRKNGKVIKVSVNDPDVIRVPNAHEAIIPRELFEKAQEIIEKRRPQPRQIRGSKHNFVLSGLLWCDLHNCTITGSGNKDHSYYVCESFRRHGRKESDCPSLKKKPLEDFIVGILKEKIFTLKRIKESVKYLIDTKQNEDEAAQNELKTINKKRAKLKRDIDGLNKGMIDSGYYPQSTMKLVTELESELSKLNDHIVEIKNEGNQTPGLNKLTLDEKTIRDIQHQAYSVLDNESPENLRVFLRNYIEVFKISGNSITIEFKFGDPNYSSQDMVAGVVLRSLAQGTFQINIDISVFSKNFRF
jgi:DNA invertase Pin-like site-specific DNA recombinase